MNLHQQGFEFRSGVELSLELLQDAKPKSDTCRCARSKRFGSTVSLQKSNYTNRNLRSRQGVSSAFFIAAGTRN